jgi:hypothetical protein
VASTWETCLISVLFALRRSAVRRQYIRVRTCTLWLVLPVFCSLSAHSSAMAIKITVDIDPKISHLLLGLYRFITLALLAGLSFAEIPLVWHRYWWRWRRDYTLAVASACLLVAGTGSVFLCIPSDRTRVETQFYIQDSQIHHQVPRNGATSY